MMRIRLSPNIRLSRQLDQPQESAAHLDIWESTKARSQFPALVQLNVAKRCSNCHSCGPCMPAKRPCENGLVDTKELEECHPDRYRGSMYYQVLAEKLLCSTFTGTAKLFRPCASSALSGANGQGIWLRCYTQRGVAAARVMPWLAVLVKT